MNCSPHCYATISKRIKCKKSKTRPIASNRLCRQQQQPLLVLHYFHDTACQKITTICLSFWNLWTTFSLFRETDNVHVLFRCQNEHNIYFYLHPWTFIGRKVQKYRPTDWGWVSLTTSRSPDAPTSHSHFDETSTPRSRPFYVSCPRPIFATVWMYSNLNSIGLAISLLYVRLCCTNPAGNRLRTGIIQ